MNYTLTNDSIIIEGREPIKRKEFENWVVSYSYLEREDMSDFWNKKIEGYDPEEMIQDWLNHKMDFTEVDGIKRGIDRICK